MDELDVLHKAMLEYEQATKAKKLNAELLDYLRNTLYWLFKYSEKYNISLPKKDEILRMIERADSLIDQIASDENLQDKKTDDKLPIPKTDTFIRYSYRTIR